MNNKRLDIDIQTYKIGVIGAGSWGTALCHLLASKGFQVDLWVFEADVCQHINTHHENPVFLPGVTLSTNINATNDLAQAVNDKDLLLLVVPSHVMRHTAGNMKGKIAENCILVTASKGIENMTHLTMTGILKQVLPEVDENRLAVLSGPSFAREVAQNLPTAVTAASKNEQTAAMVQHVFATPLFRVYTHADTIGVELGGAVKNVIALAAGIVDGLQLGLNTRAALITRGLAEMCRLGKRLGADMNTFSGLAGAGDLILTCTGTLSRNHTVGKKVGEGHSLETILSEMRMVAEGVKTAQSVYNLSNALDVEMPIVQAVYHILYDHMAPQEAVHQLMTRDLKNEFEE